VDPSLGGLNDLDIDLDALAVANRARAAEVVHVLTDVGMAVRVVEQYMTGDAGGMPRVRTTDPFERSARPAPDVGRPTGVRVTIIDEREAGNEPFSGVCVEWITAAHVGLGAAEALGQLMELGGELPDPLPAPLERNGRLNAIMQDAIRSILTSEGLVVREDTDYRPYALWVLDPAAAPS